MIDWLKKYDIFAKLMCLALAGMLWFYVVNAQNPETETEIKGIKVELRGVDEIESKYGLTLISGADATVNVKVKGRRERIFYVTNEKIFVSLDVSTVKGTGKYSLPYTIDVNVDGVTVTGRSPSLVTVEFDKNETVAIPVDSDIKVETEKGFVAGSVALSRNTVEVKGPSNELAKISAALVKLELTKLSSDYEAAVGYILVDGAGKEIKSQNIIKLTESINVSIPVNKIKEVPLSLQLDPVPGIDLSMVTRTLSAPTVKLIGQSGRIDAVENILLPSVDLAGFYNNPNQELALKIPVPEGVSLYESSEYVTATISVTGLTASGFSPQLVNAVNLDSEWIAAYKDEIVVKIYGKEEDISKITPEMFDISADFSQIELQAGAVNAPLAVTFAGEYNIFIDAPQTVAMELISLQ